MSSPSARLKAAHAWARDDLDFYVEPERCTAELLSVERFLGPVWDPACGSGNVLRACCAAGLECFGSDVVCRLPPDLVRAWADEFDFLADGAPRPPTDIITNPPFFRARGTEAFVRKALTVARGKVAVFTDIKFLASARRAGGLFVEHTPHRIWVLANRPSCPPGAYLEAGGTAKGGTADWIWLVWDQLAPRAARPELGWISGKGGAA